MNVLGCKIAALYHALYTADNAAVVVVKSEVFGIAPDGGHLVEMVHSASRPVK